MEELGKNMSFRSSRMDEEILNGVIAAGLLLYGCGPNIVLGTVGSTVHGFIVLHNKIKKISAEKIVANAKNGVERKKALRNVRHINKAIENHLQSCSILGWSMIPFCGPFIAIEKADS